MQTYAEIIEVYEKKIRKGYPAGEVRAELLEKGFSETEVDSLLANLQKVSAKKGRARAIDFRMFISAVLILIGMIQFFVLGSGFGIWIIVSGCIKIIYDMVTRKDQAV